MMRRLRFWLARLIEPKSSTTTGMSGGVWYVNAEGFGRLEQ